jgi:hypothetical protein
VPPDAKGVTVMVRVLRAGGAKDLYIDSADAPNIAPSSIRHRVTTNVTADQYLIPLGVMGANAGKIKLSVASGELTDQIYAWPTGWWR